MKKMNVNKNIEENPSADLECDLDNGFDPEINTWKEISLKKILNSIVHSRYLQILILLTLLSSILRFYQITFNCLWLDEAYTYFFSKNSFIDIWFITFFGEVHPPLFYWIEHFMLYFGNSELVLRFFPALLGICTIPLMYILGKEFMDRNCGIIMAALLAISPFHIFFSQEARAYTTMLFFFTIALIFYIRALRNNTSISWMAFGIFSGFTFWAHFYSFIPIIFLIIIAMALNFTNIMKNVRNIVPILKGALIFFIIALPLIIIIYEIFQNRIKSTPAWGYQGSNLIVETLRNLSGYLTGHGIGPLVVIFIALFIIGILAVYKIERNKAYFLVGMIVFPLAISWLLSFKMPMVERYLFFLIPIYFMGIAASYKVIFEIVKSKSVLYLIILTLVVIPIPVLLSYYQTPLKSDWRGLSNTIRQVSQPGDIIVLLPACNLLPFDYYYQNKTTGVQTFGPLSMVNLEESIPKDYYYYNQATGIYEYGVISIKQLENIFSQKENRRIFYITTSYIDDYDPDIQWWLKNYTIQVDKQLNPNNTYAYKYIDLYMSI